LEEAFDPGGPAPARLSLAVEAERRGKALEAAAGVDQSGRVERQAHRLVERGPLRADELPLDGAAARIQAGDVEAPPFGLAEPERPPHHDVAVLVRPDRLHLRKAAAGRAGAAPGA